MKRFLRFVLCFCLLAGLLCGGVSAADDSRSYAFLLTVDGKQEITANPEQLVNVTLVLNRTDSSDSAEMYAVQAELLYDDSFFRLVESSVMTAPGVEWTDMARRTGGRAFYLNFLSLSGGEEWDSQVQLGSFQLQVIGENGASAIVSENCIVSTANGRDNFTAETNDAQVVISTDCTVIFESAGGSEVPNQTVQFGEKIAEPEEPVREGYTFNGWYTDLDRSDPWDFASDTVRGNMTLYAAWLQWGTPLQEDVTGGTNRTILWVLIFIGLLALMMLLLLLFGKKKVTFDTCGGTPIDPLYVKKGETVERPMTPVKPGAMFAGWYTDAQFGAPWDFGADKVKKNMTLYARWR